MIRYRIFVVISILFSSVLNAQNSNNLETIIKHANDSIPSLGAILIWKNDKIIFEEYFNGANANTNFKVKSVTKSVVSALAGIANDRHLLPQLNTLIFDLFPEYATDFTKNEEIGFPELIKSNDSLKRIINLHDMLTMQTGYLWDDNSALSSRVFNSSSDPVRSTLDLPFEDFPGAIFKLLYSSITCCCCGHRKKHKSQPENICRYCSFQAYRREYRFLVM